ncbi:UDP-glucose 4-epimerase GalE [Actinomyces minihominis]|uniref:UDP-glucose 4-epimerase GalE n=1 Tax=Actinomyces minihominis TaxID=2002838 RepID=UPI000C06804E|nr:UDP-glucose 4-epimerase GalE [Actinomyces minihominis]
MSILVTGGAGYIGAHVVRLLQERGEEVIVVDDLSTGSASRIGDAQLVEIDLASDAAYRVLTDLMIDKDVDSVIHFAAKKQVGESVERPATYYHQNIGGLANLLRAMFDAGVHEMIFSSSAAVYGLPDVDMVTEDVVKKPINPYGETKLIGEWMLADCATAWGLKSIALRYFNAAGTGWADLEDPAALNLVPIILNRLRAGRDPVVFGDDYDTADGTCVRDYIHVMDLANAHLLALDALRDGRAQHSAYNVGTGTGSSVFEVVQGIRDISGWDFPVEVAGRRAGDPAYLVADSSRIETDMGFQAQFGLEDILQSAWDANQAGKKPVKVPTE